MSDRLTRRNCGVVGVSRAIRTGAPTEPLTPRYLRRPDATAPGTRKPVLR